jgi:glutaredoxin
MPRILFATVALLFAATVAAQAYRWVDKDGKIHYSQTPPPPTESTNVQKRSVGGSVVETSQLPYATQQAVTNFPVTLYTAENCVEACKEARTLLSQRGVPFRDVAIADDTTRAELKRVSGGDEVPVLAVGKQVTKGYTADVWHAALDNAGYPRSAAPVAAKAQKPVAKSEGAQESAVAAPSEQQPSGRYAPPAPDAKEAKEQADQAARTTGRYAAPAAATDPKASAAAPAQGPYTPK